MEHHSCIKMPISSNIGHGYKIWCHEAQNNGTQHNGTQHNGTQHNDTQHKNNKKCDIQHNGTRYSYVAWRLCLLSFMLCRVFIVMLKVVMLNIVLGVVVP